MKYELKGMSLLIVVEKWNAKDGGKRVLSEFINGGKHIKV